MAEPPGSYIPRKLPRSWCGDVCPPPTDRRTVRRPQTTIATERGAVAGGTSGRAERRRVEPAQLSILSSGRRHGTPPEIKSVLGLVQGSSVELVRQHLQQEGKAATRSAAHAEATRAQADLYQRIQKGGQRMPALAHLQEADIDVLYAYLTQLAGSPDASPSRDGRQAGLGSESTSSRAPATSAMTPSVHALPDRPSSYKERFRRLRRCRGQTSRRFRDEGPQRRACNDGRSGIPLSRADAGVFLPARCGSGGRVHVSGRLPAASRRFQTSVSRQSLVPLILGNHDPHPTTQRLIILRNACRRCCRHQIVEHRCLSYPLSDDL